MTVEKFLNQTYRLETQEETLAHYEAWADTYDEEITENNYAQPSRCASALAQFSTIDEINVLDIGCGSGLSGLALNDFGFKNIDGCDFSPSMLEKAKSTNVYQKLFLADINEIINKPKQVIKIPMIPKKLILFESKNKLITPIIKQDPPLAIG